MKLLPVLAAFAAPFLHAEVAGLGALREAFKTDPVVAYTPSQYQPIEEVRRAAAEGIRADLAVLRPHFAVIVTYSTNPEHGLDQIVPLAAEAKMRVILGIWDVKSVREISTAVALARQHPKTVLGIIVGNETMLRGGDIEDIETAVALVRAALPTVPVATSEPIGSYGSEDLRKLGDFHAPTLHFIFQGGDKANPQKAIAWLKDRVEALIALRGGDKPILLKEHGLPSAPAPFSEAAQREYWTLATRAFPASLKHALVFFEAFDAPWKPKTNPSEISESEAHWGAWTNDGRKPKSVVEALLKR